jgi:hypothetical protein
MGLVAQTGSGSNGAASVSRNRFFDLRVCRDKGKVARERHMFNERRKWWLMGLMTVSIGLAALPAVAQDQDGNDPPARVARIGDLDGTVSLMTAGAQQWSDAPANYPMISGDRIYTDQGARVEVQAGSTQVRMWGGTDLTLTNLTDDYEQIGLAQGSIRVRIYGLNRDGTVEVDTPNGAVVITRPGDYRIDAYQGDAGSDVVVNAGEVQITGPGVNQELEAGQAVRLNGSDQIQMTPVDVPGFDDLDNWSIQRDHHILNSRSAQYVNRDMVGYDDLDDNGNWSQESDYGPVWYPSRVDPDWRPYTYGHWAYVEPWGYTWVDDASWGYAPFHYGRWVEVRNRWGWVPGPREVVPVYSPALVAFVGGPHVSIGVSFGGGGGGVAAWFPLGVGEPYVPWYHCSPTYVRQVNVTNVNVTNIHNTTIVNNYNTFITNTRTVNNVNNIRVDNIQYQHRAAVVAVPQNAMASGGQVRQMQVRLNQQQQQQLAQAPVHFAPSAPAPAHPILAPRQNVHATMQRPVLMTTRGASRAVPASNTVRAAPPVNLPKPAPPTALPRPVPGAAIRPISPNGGRPNPGSVVATPTNRPGQPTGTYTRPGTPVNTAPVQNGQRPATNQPATNQPPVNRPVYTPPQQTQRPAPPTQPATPPPAYRPPAQTERPNTPPPQQTQRPAPPTQPDRTTTPPPPAYRPPAQQQRPYTPPPQQTQRPAPPTQPDRSTPPPPAYRPPPQQQRPYTPPPQQQRPAPPSQPDRTTPPPPAYRPPAQQERPAPPPQRPAPNTERPAPPPPQREAPPAKPAPEKKQDNKDKKDEPRR